MTNKARGFTLIEVMIVVAIIALLAAIAIPQFRHYTQRSANNACLAEATAYVSQSMSLIVNERAAEVTAPHHKACASGPSVTESDYNDGTTLTYVPRLRGHTGDLRNTQCNAGSRSCGLAP